uniref:Crossover junction endonuclease MUS81-like HHH domain-containing protein n=1 Tax=Hyaloperonospora arabidopsidis (strain Emoy2) TaxID=559515 RepID=M4BKW2_HYAAE
MTALAKSEEDEVIGDAEEEEERVREPSPKLPRLAEDELKKPAAVGSNQVIVNALFDYAEEQLQQGHTGKGVTHLRAARALRDHSSAVTTGTEARDVPLVGTKLAAEVEQILESGKVEDTTEVGNPDEDKPTETRLVRELRASTAKCAENQPVVDKLLRYGEHQLHARNGSKGTSYLRAARKLQLTDHVIASGAQAREEVALVGPVIADAIDQILEHGCIGKDATCSTKTIETDSSEKDRDENSAVRPENQFIVDALVDYGDRCFQLSQWEEGVTHLRAAKAIRDADVTVTTGKQAAEELNECPVVDKINSIIDGHNNAVEEDEVVDDDDGAVGRTSSIEEVGEKYDQAEASSDSSISEEEEQEPALAFAATRLQDAAELVADSSVVKALGCIGEKVAIFISTGVALNSAKDTSTDDDDETKDTAMDEQE